MKFCAAMGLMLVLSGIGSAQQKSAPSAESKVVTVPAIIDHNRVIIDVGIPTPDGSTERVHGWIDTGNPELFESSRIAGRVGATFECMGQICTTFAPPKIVINDMDISFDSVKGASWPDRNRPDTTM